MKILVDMNLSPGWAVLLTQSGFPAVHWSTLGAATAPDSEIMAYAKQNAYVVLTHDLDFSAILAATGGEKPSVVQIRADDVSTQTTGARVVAALRQMCQQVQDGALLTIDTDRARLRILSLLR